MSVAMMQPYLFPYLGYFQLLKAVDVFIFADDVNFIKGGFIHRNKILLQNEEYYIIVPCEKKSQNKLINEVRLSTKTKGYPDSILLTIKQAYAKAPFYTDVFPIIESIFHSDIDSLYRLAASSVESVSRYLELNVDFKYSSVSFNHTKGQEKSIRLINITKELGGHTYLNPIGGTKIYNKECFENQGIKLEFLVSEAITYPQFNGNFIPDLSIIDVMMFNSIEDVNKLLNKYRLII
ncbi:MAG: WbqC family protein [Eudoraea sp.]|uniref:WbqC family protein n=1 Tax=Eudoraea sp. TaxID=1979955 RepID=UPI0032630D0C